MRLGESLEAVAAITPEGFADLRRDVDPEWISEIAYAANLWPSVPDDSLTIIDRGFLSARILLALARDGTNRHWLIRTKKHQRWRVLHRLLERWNAHATSF